MFKIQLSPVAGSKDTAISANGDTLTINGLEIDFSPLAEGEQCETELPLIGMAKRVGGVISVTVMYEYDSATAEPMQSMNAADYVIELTDGAARDVIRRRPAAPVLEMPAADPDSDSAQTYVPSVAMPTEPVPEAIIINLDEANYRA